MDHGDFSGSMPLKDSGWCVLRASTDAGRYPVLDNYVYATTSPIYVTVGGPPPHSPEDARYFAAWIDRMAETTAAYPDWNNAAEKHGVLEGSHRRAPCSWDCNEACRRTFEPPAEAVP